MATAETGAPFVPCQDFDQPAIPPVTALARRSVFEQARELVGYLKDIDIISDALCKSTLLPKNMQAPANLKLVLLQGLEMGFSVVQAIRASYVIESKEAPPRVGYYVEALVALVRKSTVCRFFRVEECTPEMCRVVCARSDEAAAVIHTFELSMKQAQAGNLDKRWDWEKKEFAVKFPWKAAPSDMLRNRCCGRAVKTVFQDVVFGMSTPDELDDLATADSMDRHGGFEAIPVEPTRRHPRAAEAPVDADIVEITPAGEVPPAHDEGTGDPGWDAALAEIAKGAGVGLDMIGWMPDDLAEEWARRCAGAADRKALNALGGWMASMRSRADKSRACGTAAAAMAETFNARSGELKVAAAKPSGGAA